MRGGSNVVMKERYIYASRVWFDAFIIQNINQVTPFLRFF